MRPVLICPDDLLEHVVTAAAFPGERPLYLVSRASLRARLARRGDRAMAGKVTNATFLHEALKGGRGPVVVAAPAGQLARVIAAVKEAVPDAPLLVLRDDDRPVSNATVVPLSAFGERIVQPALERAAQRARAERLRAHFYDAERVLILMQDDPDPDAIASALALKTLLGRTRASAPMCTFGTITRPENVAMCKILEIEVEAIDAAALDQFDRVAMVDVQPSYGATSTIMVEYLRAADVKITQRLATALLYGIKSDTLGLERGGTKADLEAFSYLYLLANHNALRRIERPELSPEALDVLARGLAKRRVVQGVFFSHLGRVATVDLIPQFADFGLQAEGVQWSVVSGVVDDDVHVSVRNVGYVRSAGDVTRAAFGELGMAGGHRTMAKAVFPLRQLGRGAGEPAASGACQERIIERFVRALGGNAKSSEASPS